jgi:hypothetical protein
MAARTALARTAAQHQALLHLVANAAWSDEDVLAKVYRKLKHRRSCDEVRCVYRKPYSN